MRNFTISNIRIEPVKQNCVDDEILDLQDQLIIEIDGEPMSFLMDTPDREVTREIVYDLDKVLEPFMVPTSYLDLGGYVHDLLRFDDRRNFIWALWTWVQMKMKPVYIIVKSEGDKTKIISMNTDRQTALESLMFHIRYDGMIRMDTYYVKKDRKVLYWDKEVDGELTNWDAYLNTENVGFFGDKGVCMECFID